MDGACPTAAPAAPQQPVAFARGLMCAMVLLVDRLEHMAAIPAGDFARDLRRVLAHEAIDRQSADVRFLSDLADMLDPSRSQQT